MATLHALKNRLTASQLNLSAPVDSADLCHDDKNTRNAVEKIDVKQFFLVSKKLYHDFDVCSCTCFSFWMFFVIKTSVQL